MFNDIYKLLKSMEKIEKELGKIFKIYKKPNQRNIFNFPKSSYIIPKTSIIETESKIKLEVEMPGILFNDIKINLSTDLIEIITKKSNIAPFKCYYALIPLPAKIYMKSLKKTYKKGKLTISFDKYKQNYLRELEEF